MRLLLQEAEQSRRASEEGTPFITWRRGWADPQWGPLEFYIPVPCVGDSLPGGTESYSKVMWKAKKTCWSSGSVDDQEGYKI